jgi:hypothetical protein
LEKHSGKELALVFFTNEGWGLSLRFLLFLIYQYEKAYCAMNLLASIFSNELLH